MSSIGPVVDSRSMYVRVAVNSNSLCVMNDYVSDADTCTHTLTSKIMHAIDYLHK